MIRAVITTLWLAVLAEPATGQIPEFTRALDPLLSEVSPSADCTGCAARIPVITARLGGPGSSTLCVEDSIPSTYFTERQPRTGIVAMLSAKRGDAVEQTAVLLVLPERIRPQLSRICWNDAATIALPGTEIWIELMTSSVIVYNKSRSWFDYFFGSGMYSYQQVSVELPKPSLLILGSGAEVRFPRQPVWVRKYDLERSRIRSGRRQFNYASCVRAPSGKLLRLMCA